MLVEFDAIPREPSWIANNNNNNTVSSNPLEPGPVEENIFNLLSGTTRSSENNTLGFSGHTTGSGQFTGEDVSFIAHEVRTSLTGINGVVPMLQETELSPEQRNLLDLIEISGTHLMTFLNSILDVAKLKAGKLELDKIPVKVGAEVETAVRICAPSARAKQLDINVSFPPDLPSLLSDPVRFRQVLINLLHNAIKFTEKGYIAVRCEWDQHGSNVIVRISDSGPGMPEEKVSTLFLAESRFSSSNAQRQHGGTGLGMNLVSSMVEMLGAKIIVNSEVQVGTIFSVVFPLTEPTVAVETDLSSSLKYTGLTVILLSTPSSEGEFPFVNPNSTEGALQTTLTDLQVRWVRPNSIADLTCLDQTIVQVVFVSPSILNLTGHPVSLWLSRASKASVVCLAPHLGIGIAAETKVHLHPILPSVLRATFTNCENTDEVTDGPSLLKLQCSGSAHSSGFETCVLVAEDNFVSRKVIARQFETIKIQCLVVSDGVEALTSYVREPERFAIIFLDVEMPGMTGPECAKHIRQHEETVHGPHGFRVPIIGLTGHTAAEAQVKFGSTASYCITKPITGPALIEVLEQVADFKYKSNKSLIMQTSSAKGESS
jgi:two-component system sensor histidine kinase BarA